MENLGDDESSTAPMRRSVSCPQLDTTASKTNWTTSEGSPQALDSPSSPAPKVKRAQSITKIDTTITKTKKAKVVAVLKELEKRCREDQGLVQLGRNLPEWWLLREDGTVLRKWKNARLNKMSFLVEGRKLVENLTAVCNDLFMITQPEVEELMSTDVLVHEFIEFCSVYDHLANFIQMMDYMRFLYRIFMSGTDEDEEVRELTIILHKSLKIITFVLDNDRVRPFYKEHSLDLRACLVCLETKYMRLRWCCDLHVCEKCVSKYVSYKVKDGLVSMRCLNSDCKNCFSKAEVPVYLNEELQQKFLRLLVEAERDPLVKTCPRCTTITRISSEEKGKKGLQITCKECSLVWCFPCQAPAHEGISCVKYMRGDKLFKKWAKTAKSEETRRNAQRCPKCKVYIEKIHGCNHMTCVRCETDFCHSCGGRWDIPFLGQHESMYNPLGCKYVYRDKPVRRKLVRGSIAVGCVAAAPVVISLAVPCFAIGGVSYFTYQGSKRVGKVWKDYRKKRGERHHEEYLRRIREKLAASDRIEISEPIENLSVCYRYNDKMNYQDEL